MLLRGSLYNSQIKALNLDTNKEHGMREDITCAGSIDYFIDFHITPGKNMESMAT